MTADLLVVAKNQRSLYEYLQQDFAEDPDVEVVMDRRQADRRQGRGAWTAERRHNQRRTRPPIDDKLASIGFAVCRTGGPGWPPDPLTLGPSPA